MPELYIFGMDKLLHVLEYFIFGYLLVNSVSDKPQYPVYISFVIGICYWDLSSGFVIRSCYMNLLLRLVIEIRHSDTS